MKIALVSAPVWNGDIDRNVRTMVRYLGKLRGQADVVVFGESVLQGFDCLCWDYAADRHTAVTLTDASIQRMRTAARESGTAVSFGFVERYGETLYSSQIFIGADGKIINVFHRVSAGWKDCRFTDDHYREGERFASFPYCGKTFAVGLCGDLWTAGRPAEMRALSADVVLWPVWCDYPAGEWNRSVKLEYARQAGQCGHACCLSIPAARIRQRQTQLPAVRSGSKMRKSCQSCRPEPRASSLRNSGRMGDHGKYVPNIDKRKALSYTDQVKKTPVFAGIGYFLRNKMISGGRHGFYGNTESCH